MRKPAETTFPIHTLLAERWSPRAFKDEPVAPEQLGSLFEAARWAASCFNAQPWRFLVATRDRPDDFARLASCLVEGNAWAKAAPVLVLTVAQLAFEHNGKPNRHALHDVGLAAAGLTVQAQASGLAAHQMAGFDAGRAREVLAIPERFEPVAMIAIGHAAEPDTLPDALREREVAPRQRKGLGEIVFGAGWESPHGVFAG